MNSYTSLKANAGVIETYLWGKGACQTGKNTCSDRSFLFFRPVADEDAKDCREEHHTTGPNQHDITKEKV
jgi:hypothetical protein